MLLIVVLVVPSLYVSVHGAVPVKVTVNVPLPPLHMIADPLSSAVGIGFTEIVVEVLKLCTQLGPPFMLLPIEVIVNTSPLSA